MLVSRDRATSIVLALLYLDRADTVAPELRHVVPFGSAMTSESADPSVA